MIKTVETLKTNELKSIGGKGHGLLWLHSQSYAVPEFYFITNEVIKSWQKESIKLQLDIGYSEEEAMRSVIASSLCHIDSKMWENVAIRSSALDEDGEQDSFAGIYESVLNVRNFENAVEALIKVILSFSSESSITYRNYKGLNYSNKSFKSSTAMENKAAIVIQKMVYSIYSGVSFSINPQTGCRNSVWITATSGLGDKLVSGLIQGDEYLFENQSITKISGSSTDIKSVLLEELAAITQSIAKKKGSPQDIEWSYDGEKLWILQVRPVTTTFLDKKLPQTVFDNSNIQESYCGVTTPLTFTYASVCYTRVYRQLMKFMLLNENEIERSQWNLENMLGLVQGRVYYNINNWYAGLLYLPSFGKRKEEMEDMMGLESPVDFVQGKSLSLQEKIKKIPQMSMLMIVMGYRFLRLDHLTRDFDEWFQKIYNEADINRISFLSEFEIFERIRIFQDRFLEKWSIPVLNDTKVMMDMGKVKRLLKKYHFEGELKSLLYGNEIESIKPTLGIHYLSQIFAQDNSLKQTLFDYKGKELWQILEIFFPKVLMEIKQYIHDYGDRCMGELKLETITMRQDPEVLFQLIRNYVQSGLAERQNLFHHHETQEMFLSVIAQMNFWEKWRFKSNIKALKKSIAAREKMRMHRTRNFGLMRSLYLALGEKWSQRNIISDSRDIFYLTHSEIFSIGSGQSVTTSLKELVKLRKFDFEQFKNFKPATQVRVEFPSSQFRISTSSSKQNKTDHQWTGLAAARGVCEGEVVWVQDSSQISNLQGKILLAERTDPGWTPLFPLIKGVIVEKGSMLSHSAIIAREMGIPSVIAIPHITEILKTGDIIRLDGDHGTIELLSRKDVSTQHIAEL